MVSRDSVVGAANSSSEVSSLGVCSDSVSAAFNRKGAIAEIVGPAQPAERTPTPEVP